MRFSEVKGRKVMDTTSAQQVAEVAGFVVSEAEARIAAVRLRKVQGDGSLVDWASLKAFGVDAVTVEGTAGFRRPTDEREQRAAKGDVDLEGRSLLTDQGRLVGRITDVEFDPDSGAITELVTDGESVPGDRLLGVGSFAAVVNDDRAPAQG